MLKAKYAELHLAYKSARWAIAIDTGGSGYPDLYITSSELY